MFIMVYLFLLLFIYLLLICLLFFFIILLRTATADQKGRLLIDLKRKYFLSTSMAKFLGWTLRAIRAMTLFKLSSLYVEVHAGFPLYGMAFVISRSPWCLGLQLYSECRLHNTLCFFTRPNARSHSGAGILIPFDLTILYHSRRASEAASKPSPFLNSSAAMCFFRNGSLAFKSQCENTNNIRLWAAFAPMHA